MKIFDIIEYKGDNKTLIHKHEATDFNTLSTLVVRESQRVILFKDGQALDMFGPGRHVLHTDNIPLLRRIVNIPTNGETPFKCEVYFINKTEQMAIKWGVGDVDFCDPYFNNYRFTIGANGELSIKVIDERRLIVKLVGAETDFSQEYFINYFKSVIIMHVKSALPKLLKELKANVYSLESELPQLSKALQELLSIEMLDYGISIEKLWINAILKPEDDKNFKALNELYAQNTLQAVQAKNDYDELLRRKTIELENVRRDKEIRLTEKQTEFEIGKMDVDLEKYRLRELGITRQQELGFEVMNNIAKNEGAGSDFRNMGMGFSMGCGVGSVFGASAAEIGRETLDGLMSSPIKGENEDPFRPEVNQLGTTSGIPHEVNLADIQREPSINVKEMENRAFKAVHDIAWYENEMQKLKIMKEIMTPEEYEAKRQELISSIGQG